MATPTATDHEAALAANLISRINLMELTASRQVGLILTQFEASVVSEACLRMLADRVSKDEGGDPQSLMMAKIARLEKAALAAITKAGGVRNGKLAAAAARDFKAALAEVLNNDDEEGQQQEAEASQHRPPEDEEQEEVAT